MPLLLDLMASTSAARQLRCLPIAAPSLFPCMESLFGLLAACFFFFFVGVAIVVFCDVEDSFNHYIDDFHLLLWREVAG